VVVVIKFVLDGFGDEDEEGSVEEGVTEVEPDVEGVAVVEPVVEGVAVVEPVVEGVAVVESVEEGVAVVDETVVVPLIL